MGCFQNKNQKIIITQNHNLKNKIKSKNTLNLHVTKIINCYIYKISYQNWLNIIDFLNYTEIKETGKVNRFFNKTVKDNTILLKFFKNRGNNKNKYNIEKYISTKNNII